MAARHALRDHYFHRPYSGPRLYSPLLAIGPMRGLLASEAAGKGAQEASTFHLEMKDDRDLYGKPCPMSSVNRHVHLQRQAL
jgi:hypothetical protein